MAKSKKATKKTISKDQLVTKRKIKRYGWIPDLPDIRDHMYAAPMPPQGLPKSVDLAPLCPAIYDQGDLGSCTANAIGGAFQFLRIKQKLAQAKTRVPSRLYIYFNEREIEGTINEDSGAYLRDGIKSVAKLGVCYEKTGGDGWPYNIAKFTQRPPVECYGVGDLNQAIQYNRITPTLTQLKGCLASGFPFVFGFTVYESFESQTVANTGIVPMPGDESVLGGHAVLAVGYDDAQQRFKIRNSWGAGWGKAGHCWMPYPYLTDNNLSDDFWTIRMVEPGT